MRQSSSFLRRRLLPLGLLLAPTGAVFAQTNAGDEPLLAAVRVSASKTQSQELRRNASAGRIIVDRDELDALGASTMAELLSRLPGGGNSADIDGGARGRQRSPDPNMPQILVDGQPLPGGARNPMAALRLPVELIERVEIIRNSTAEFPVLSPGGVINLVLRDVPGQLTRSARIGVGVSDGEPSSRVEGQYGAPDAGDFGYLLAGAYSGRPLVGTQTIATTSAGASSSEQATQSGHDDNLTLSPRFSWKLGDGQRLTLTPFVSHTDSARDSRIDNFSAGVATKDLLQQGSRRSTGRLAAEWRSDGAAGSATSARLLLQGERDDATRTTRAYDAGGGLLAPQAASTLRAESETALELRRKQLFLDSHVLTGAIEWRDKSSDDRQSGSGANALVRVGERRLVGWLQDEWQVAEQHVLTPGLRFAQLQTTIDDGSSVARKTRSSDPSLHYLWQIDEQWNLRASIAGNTRTPQTREQSPVVREASGVNSASNPDRGGNAQLAAERLRSVEFGVEHFLAARGGSVGFSVFDRQIDNYVQRLIADEGGRWVERPFNVGRARLRGALLDFKAKLAVLDLPDLTLRGNVAYTETKMLEAVAGLGSGEGARKSANLGADYEIAAWRLALGGNYSYSSALTHASSATIRQQQGARRQLDLYALQRIDQQLAIRFTAQNLTRETRSDSVVEFDAGGLPSRQEIASTPGVASVMATLEIKW